MAHICVVDDKEIIRESGIWKPIKGFEHRYEVSTNGEVWDILEDQQVRPEINPETSPKILFCLLEKNSTYILHAVKRLVATTFKHQAKTKHKNMVSNIDGDHYNNAAENLEWIQPSKEFDGKSTQTRLTPTIVLSMRDDYYLKDIPIRELAEKYAVSNETVQKVMNRTVWNTF